MLTALAVQGYAELAARLRRAADEGLLEIGVAYVAFALDRPAHFQLLFRSDLVDPDNVELQRARSTLSQQLIDASRPFSLGSRQDQSLLNGEDAAATRLVAWSMAHHDLATLALADNLASAEGQDVLGVARAALRHLTPS